METARQVERTDAVVNRFHELYYLSRKRTWENTRWLGTLVAKCPLDLWIYQEILWERRPDLIIETGTAHGGSALYLASVLDRIGAGRIVTIDIEEFPNRPAHPRIEYHTGDSVDPRFVADVGESVGERVMVILDSDHSRDHVLAELHAFAPLVTPGDYLIVEDTNVGGNPVVPYFGPGPMEAVEDYLAKSDAFAVDESREKFFMTFNPRGYLKRV